MRSSNFFIPTLRDEPAQAQVISHRLMLRAGMIDMIAPGLYTWLPLGLRALKKVSTAVRKSQEAIGASEVMMPCIQPAALWQKSGRYEDYGKELLRMKDRHEVDMLFGPTGEELFTDLFRKHVKSYKDLPLSLFQIQVKFRDEIRPRHGVMRAREFYMKDLYSFDLDEASARQTYEKVLGSYLKVFRELGVPILVVRADTGPIGGDLSHEFHIISETGESDLFYDKGVTYSEAPTISDLDRYYAKTSDLHDPASCELSEEQLVKSRGIEVGHIFYFGTKYSKSMGACVMGPDGQNRPVEMGSYGIGVGRLVAGIIERFHDEKGIVWPEGSAPFDCALINVKPENREATSYADALYGQLQDLGIEVLYDDRSCTPGVKFADQDLIGLPFQIILGPRGIKMGTVDLKERSSGREVSVPLDQVAQLLKEKKIHALFQEETP